MNEASLFDAALALATPGERAAYLDQACKDNPELRRAVEELLAAHAASNPLDRPPLDIGQTGAYQPSSRNQLPAVGRVSQVIAERYKLVELIGQGGMGEVWMAQQTEPVKRGVALKLIREGMDSKNVLARFEAERQALAMMDHPNIAKVLEAGLHDGRPFFVMELVKGVPITEFCDQRKLNLHERLELFIPVCQAIQHAHQKGIIHRDIKPSNVLVAMFDDRPVPKVIDFGVAKATGNSLTDRTLMTGFGAIVGTPEYMSPEQASFNQLDIDTRSDVYALGVLLYELLTGTTPVDRKSLGNAAVLEVLRLVREVEAPRPSAKLSTNSALPIISANRSTEPARLTGILRSELDWIVLKALEKDRSRRYETANNLARDVQRYLTGDAVEACPPTFGYRLKKAYQRNRAAVWVGIAFTLLMLTGVAVSTLLAIQARRAEAVAEEQRAEAEDNKNAYYTMMEAYLETAREAEIRSNSARIDADLLEYRSDSRVGLLRLARPLKGTVGPLPYIAPHGTGTIEEGLGPEFDRLRQFQAAAVIAAGQEFVPLLPPFASEKFPESSPDGRLCIIGSEREGLRLIEIPSLRQIGVLREGTERVVKHGFSPDGKTIYTQDTDSIVRFWNTDSTFRAKTPLRPERFVYPKGMTVEEVRDVADRANPVLVTDGVAVLESRTPGRGDGKSHDDYDANRAERSPADFYSTRTGQFLRRPDRPANPQRWGDWRKSPDQRWLVGSDVLGDHAVIVSATDGRELARLDHPGSQPFFHVVVSPNGHWAYTYRSGGTGEKHPLRPDQIRLWRSADWSQVQDAALIDALTRLKEFAHLRFVTDDLLLLTNDYGVDNPTSMICLGKPIGFTRSANPGRLETGEYPLELEQGRFLRCGRVLIELSSLQRLKPPPGRRYAAELAQLAPDGRFFEDLDTITEKELPHMNNGFESFRYAASIPDFGQVTPLWDNRNACHYLGILPNPKRLTVPPPMLELWAKLVVGGELTPEGSFQPWDQPTWAAKQKELTAMQSPDADFPFPGWVTQEPHLWYRIRANQLNAGQERDKFLDEWRRRSGRTLPKTEPDTWRTPGPDPTEKEKK